MMVQELDSTSHLCIYAIPSSVYVPSLGSIDYVKLLFHVGFGRTLPDILATNKCILLGAFNDWARRNILTLQIEIICKIKCGTK